MLCKCLHSKDDYKLRLDIQPVIKREQRGEQIGPSLTVALI